MAFITSYVAKPTKISFHRFLKPLGWIRIENVIQSGPGDVAMEVRAGVPQWNTVVRN